MTNIEAVLERIEAFPNSLQDEELYFYDESDTDITIANLIALAAAYREQAEMIKALRVFSDFVLAEFWLGVPDAGACQDKAVELGLLEGVEVMEPCGTWCECDDFPQTCYRFTDILTGKPLAAQKAMEGEGNGK